MGDNTTMSATDLVHLIDDMDGLKTQGLQSSVVVEKKMMASRETKAKT